MEYCRLGKLRVILRFRIVILPKPALTDIHFLLAKKGNFSRQKSAIIPAKINGTFKGILIDFILANSIQAINHLRNEVPVKILD